MYVIVKMNTVTYIDDGDEAVDQDEVHAKGGVHALQPCSIPHLVL